MTLSNLDLRPSHLVGGEVRTAIANRHRKQLIYFASIRYRSNYWLFMEGRNPSVELVTVGLRPDAGGFVRNDIEDLK